MKTATLTKIKEYKGSDSRIHLGWGKNIGFDFIPKVGEQFIFDLGGHTSPVLSIYNFKPPGKAHHHKVEFPADFPERNNVEIPSLQPGDIIFATKNSVYWLANIQDVEKDR